MSSMWQKGIKKPEFGSLNGDVKTDVLIIGGGLTGILCAYELEQAGVDYILVEAKEICSSITQNTTAKVTAQHGIIYNKLIKEFGTDAAGQYYNANTDAINYYRSICQAIGCEFEEKSAFVYSRFDRAEIEAELSAYQKIGVSASFTDKTALPFKVEGAVLLPKQGQINPLEFLYKLAKDLNIKEHTKVLEFKKGLCTTDKGSIKYKKAIVATHFPIINKHGFYFLKMYQHRSYVLALKGAQDVGGMFVDADIKGLSFRNYREFLLLGGGSHRTGKKGGSYPELLSFAKEHYPSATVVERFATQDCMTLDGVPYIGEYSPSTPELFVATGYNKWGFSSAMTAAKILRDMVLEKPNEYAKLFSPSRGILHPQLAVNGFESVVNLLTPTKPRCPHLGCALKYNKQEHSWDCPCHGSRFSADGKLLDNPATDDMVLKGD